MSLQSQAAKPAAKAAKPQKLDLKELQRKQLDGEDPDTQQGNTAEGADYDFPAHEADRVHVRLTKKVNDPIKKEYTEEVAVKKFVPAQYDRMVVNNYFDTQTYDKVEVLHDPRRGAGAKPAEPTFAEKEGIGPMNPVPGLPTLQDAQMRFQQLFGVKAPAIGYDDLIDMIREKEASTGEHEDEDQLDDDQDTGGDAGRKFIRSTADAQARYKELYGEDAPADASFGTLKSLIAAKESSSDIQQ